MAIIQLKKFTLQAWRFIPLSRKSGMHVDTNGLWLALSLALTADPIYNLLWVKIHGHSNDELKEVCVNSSAVPNFLILILVFRLVFLTSLLYIFHFRYFHSNYFNEKRPVYNP